MTRYITFNDTPAWARDVMQGHGIRPTSVPVEIGTEPYIAGATTDHMRVILYAHNAASGVTKAVSGSYGGENPFATHVENTVNRGGTMQLTGPEQMILRINGKYPTLYCHPEAVSKLLPATMVEVTWEEKVVLVATRSLKSSYNGIKDYRKHSAMQDTGITSDEYDAGKRSCIEKGYLTTAGAITAKGRNEAGDCSFQLYSLARPGYNKWGFAVNS